MLIEETDMIAVGLLSEPLASFGKRKAKLRSQRRGKVVTYGEPHEQETPNRIDTGQLAMSPGEKGKP